LDCKVLLAVDIAHVLEDGVLDVGRLAVADETVLRPLEQHKCVHADDLDDKLYDYIRAQVGVAMNDIFVLAEFSKVFVIVIRIRGIRNEEFVI
jgi:hypothetical protein